MPLQERFVCTKEECCPIKRVVVPVTLQPTSFADPTMLSTLAASASPFNINYSESDRGVDRSLSSYRVGMRTRGGCHRCRRINGHAATSSFKIENGRRTYKLRSYIGSAHWSQTRDRFVARTAYRSRIRLRKPPTSSTEAFNARLNVLLNRRHAQSIKTSCNSETTAI